MREGRGAGGTTMIRNTLAAIANTWTWARTPAPELFPVRLAMIQPVLVPAPPTYVLQPKRNYRVHDAEQPAPIIGAAANDLMAYPHTHNALIKALEVHYTVAGPLREHTVIIEARDWIGEFTIESNVNADRLTLLLVEGGVPVQMDERPPVLAWA
jgi:hypothetical protein